MTILALDTTGTACTAALRREGCDDLVLTEAIGRGHAERLAPMVQDLLTEADISAQALDRIGVTVGPGSFAGSRVGVAFARGLSLSSAAPAFGLSNLAVIAAEHVETRPLAVIHDAKRGDVVVQVFDDAVLHPAQRMRHDEARAMLQASISSGLCLAGSGAELFEELGQVVGAGAFDPRVMLDLTALSPSSASPPVPFYARPPDAKLPGGVDPS